MSLPEASPLRWNPGEHVEIIDEGGAKTLWSVQERADRGWKLKETATGKVLPFSDVMIELLGFDSRLHHYPANAALVSERQMDLMVTPRAFWPARVELVVDVKLAYCRFVDERLGKGRTKEEICRAAVVPASREGGTTGIDQADQASLGRVGDDGVPIEGATERSVHSTNYRGWRKRLRKIEIVEEAKRTSRALPETAPEDPDEDDDTYYDFKKMPWFLRPPHWRTVSDWHELWLRTNRSEGILQPDDKHKGNRTKRVHALVTTKEGAQDIYEVMGEFLGKLNVNKKRVSVGQVWDAIKLQHPEFESYFTTAKPLGRLLEKLYPESYERQKRQYGAWTARNNHRVSQAHPDPEYVMDEVEIDHCLADIIVRDENGDILGRPWITVVLDRCSRMIVGMHVSFEVPGFAAVQRCLMHAFWPKDLRRWKPGHPEFDPERELLHTWPCHGIPEVIYTDRGKEFLSIPLDRVGWSLRIRILPLPARSPHLKGKIERFFGTMHAKVYSYEEGKTFSSYVQRHEYDSYKESKLTLRDLKWKLLKWVVDDYHPSLHDGLSGIPLMVWHEKAAQKFIQPAPDARYKHSMLGKAYLVPIGRDGISVEGLLFTGPQLQRLQNIHGPGHQYHASADPFDAGQIWLFPPGARQPVVIPAKHPRLCVGVSFRHAVQARRQARKRYGRKVTPEQVAELMLESERRADERLADKKRKGGAAPEARFRLANGEFLTPVAGDSGVVARLPDAAPEPEAPAAIEVRDPPTPQMEAPEIVQPVPNVAADYKETVMRRVREKAAMRASAS
ncbi:DDE-type integrase/transposase/recombinase [Aureimonas phyllosphaerae]|uniref:Putative transposase n=1 Tax=Aureimonas phyllosphaerae TaxID=1166078 RepID=A0A7W6FW47_9HYPH|nr:DDE-type integrase/transposase/recombinase [Aureimonas phyllosphaerae]MBB3937848.1 putative transposase [Aureimonas phyllosphaerae]MBB3961821.1 putative transposase [Aureimonas phyllosphaerae]SFF50692.1 putative transposase [Aureimonas phyllosphaerae]